jgi:cytochrome c
MTWLVRTIIAIALAGMAGGALALDFRSRRRASGAPRGPTQPAKPQAEGTTTNDDEDDAKPPLSPTWFAISHFSMLVVLLSMMVIGLAMRGVRRYPSPSTWYVNGGDAARGRLVLESHGCGGCHSIDGIPGATGQVGPPLESFAQRMYIGGQLPNTPDNLIAWLQDPQRYAPGTAMPNMPISEPVARDMAAYLYARR